MNSKFVQIRDNQRNSWNSFSGGWKKWDDFTMRFLQEQGDCIINELALKPNDMVLDIASGTGEPGLAIASNIKGGGSVVATDLSEQMLQIAQTKANTQSLDNFSVLVADACELPLEDEIFDAVSCRLGFMFFPDLHLAAREMMRVLKPGGLMVATVWAEPEKNSWITTIIGALKRNMELPVPDPKGPGLFRCAAPGFLTSLFEEIGFIGGVEKTIEGIMNCQSANEYWEFMNDVVPPVVSSLNNTDEDIRKKVKLDVFNSFAEKLTDPEQGAPYAARIFTIRKPL